VKYLALTREHVVNPTTGGDGGIRTLTGGGLSALPLPIGLRPPVLPGLCREAIIRRRDGRSGCRRCGPPSVRHSAAVHPSPRRTGRVTVPAAVLVAGVLILSAWQAFLSRHSPGAHWSVALAALTVSGAAAVLGHRRHHQSARRWLARSLLVVRTWRAQPRPAVVSTLVWTVLLVGVVSWDLVSFIFQSHALPTLSYFVGHVTRHRLGRGILFALWLGAGIYLASARRLEGPQ
jgi:hypothetical protein